MGTEIYKKVDYPLKSLVEDIELGEIALPELQRPFVWRKVKVRDLFDSMYKGFPIGFLLFWTVRNDDRKERRTIGVGTKQKTPRLLIVDGQQRLTSLFAVMKDREIVNKKGEQERIQIAFNPQSKEFKVTDVAVRKNPEYIHDISKLWSSNTGKSRFVRDFLSNLSRTKELTDDEQDKISDAIDRLYNLENYSFYALELFSSVDGEQASDVFVRINSKGKSLNQADFILTLMSVFWNEGRKSLEKFCLATKTSADGQTSPFNYIVRPSPDELLRVVVGHGFRRGKLKYGYEILRGKDLKTGEFSEKTRDIQFEKLKSACKDVLNITNWHEFLKIPLSAGFQSEKMISSNVGLLFCYTLYLIGLRDFNVDHSKLRKYCSMWFYMSSLTSRYTSSPESSIQKDITEFLNCKDENTFIDFLDKEISLQLTDDYWHITLPNKLAIPSASSPSLHTYQAALCLMGAKALFSNLLIKDLFSPYYKSTRSNVERHHLFPKDYLKQNGIKETRRINQIANYAWLEWKDNNNISNKPPSKYWPEMLKYIPRSEKEKSLYWHALPNHWESMEYDKFLISRRNLIAKVIQDGFKMLKNL